MTPGPRSVLRVILWFIGVSASAGSLLAGSWRSEATGRDQPWNELAVGNGEHPAVIIYLTSLAAPRVGTESDDTILADFRQAGYRIFTLDYAGNTAARWPALNRDLAALRTQLQKKTLLTDGRYDPAHVFIVPSGYRLKRDVVYYRAAKRTLAMDILYPSRPAKPVGTVLEFSCDNENRMGNFSLNFCSDTILEGAATEGFAVAMADHPVAAPYKGLDAMPDCAWKVKAAVRTLRAQTKELPLTGAIVPVGFSRGSGMALLLATTAHRAEFEQGGEFPGVASEVQGAVVMSGRFTYLDLLPEDKMIPRYNQVWGERAKYQDIWRAHGALDYLTAPLPDPLFLTINATESPDALHQMAVLRARLTQLESPFAYHPEAEPRGHKVPLDSGVLEAMLTYLRRQLAGPPSLSP